MSGFHPRFSLLTVLLLVTIVGLSLAVVLQQRDVDRLGMEAHQLRDEVGLVEVDATHWPRVDTGGTVDSRGELVLMRHIVPPLGRPMGNQPMDGFLLWLEPIRDVGRANAPSETDP